MSHQRAQLTTLAGRQYFVFIDSSGEGLPVLPTRRAYRETIYRDPTDPKQSTDARKPVRLVPNQLDMCCECDAESVDTVFINGREYGVCENHK